MRRTLLHPDREVGPGSLRRGYTAPEALRQAIAEAHLTKTAATVSAAIVDHVTALAIVFTSAWMLIEKPWLGTCLALPAVLIIARQLRALECLVHEASHYNWSRHRRMLNDRLALMLTGLATGANIHEYRRSHLLHHGRFGTADDPDLIRYRELGIEEIRRDSYLAFASDILRKLPRYQRGWWKSMRASPTDGLLPVAWMLVGIGLPVLVIKGLPEAAVAVGLWALAHALALPIIRFVGESNEHIYTGATTMADATISNLGWAQRLIFHPHNDGYHTVHHLWPGVPHHQLRRLHTLLMKKDPEGFGSVVRIRAGLLRKPTTNVPATP